MHCKTINEIHISSKVKLSDQKIKNLNIYDAYVTKIKKRYNSYDYSKFKYIKDNIRGIVICQKHGEFLIDPDHHLHAKNGCGICAGKYLRTIEEFIKLSNTVHGNRYNYSKFILLIFIK